MASKEFFHIWVDFKTKNELSGKPFVGSTSLTLMMLGFLRVVFSGEAGGWVGGSI